jgi:2-desacetyl-2-hydroxyethyl bacteriochlorophyllide A dehydrogenase
MKSSYKMGMVAAPGEIKFETRQLRPVAAHEVLISVQAASICGSDLHIYRGAHPSAPLPSAVGHELAGEILEVGALVQRVRIGDRVAVEPLLVCGQCVYCQRGEYHLCTQLSLHYRQGQGAFAPYFYAEEAWLHPLPEALPAEQGALLEPLAVAVHAVRKANLQPGESLAVFGAGAIGLLTLQVARAAGADPVFVVDRNDFRLQQAQRFGARAAFNGSATDPVAGILQATAGLGVDVAVEAVGVEATLRQSLEVLRKGGRAVLLGIFETPQVALPVNLFVQREISLHGSQAYNHDFPTAIELASSGRVDLASMITHRLPLEQLPRAFELAAGHAEQAIKVIIERGGEGSS